jgi:hypothetical protein
VSVAQRIVEVPRFWGSYLRGWDGPHLVVVRPHEEVCHAGAHHAHDPLVKVLWLCVVYASLEGSVNHTVDALDLVLFRQHRDVVLEGVWHPELLAADVGDALVRVPVILIRQSLVDAVVEVFVMREDDMATDIVQLGSRSELGGGVSIESRGAHEAFGGDVCRG